MIAHADYFEYNYIDSFSFLSMMKLYMFTGLEHVMILVFWVEQHQEGINVHT